ncbi:phenylalanine--tRNA ligase subunit beta [Clostridium sp. YIM B02515]|uniref:Phenylalanine--tRNA ligase beta subunit n=1 Tax=Clostridium rhizosphaerae TaxID=2803861 RepID=A0ABS1TFL6_9CLOT|nr:phenylalanine--tRNA ligase subunit beta [Clostridium rhizosphaerae]MBL4938162.1 phenylalanine--tRNA ligase subunit beta [Clostridium rhizosphaerae]
MKVPYKWLKDYVNIDISPKELADRLTLSGSKVEEVITSGDEIQNVVTGKLLKIEPHPDAEKLVICQLDVAQGEELQIVTGANNMKVGDVVPVALHGSSLPNGLKIKKGKLRGIVSNGMMCSEEELGIAGEEEVHGLMILPSDTPVGKDIKDVLGLDNSVIDFEITSNRPDCLSVVGIARETAATLGVKYTMPETSYKAVNNDNITDILKVEVKDSKLCRRYMARGVKNIKIEQSPAWMQERLIQAGVRPINNIVDITNFVMIELGQPMHAFDKREITSNTIVVERAENNEKFTTLDEVERTLNSEVLNIKDGNRTIGLAGIMGGLNSEVKEDTKEIIFECANFDGTNIRVSSKALGIRTEASSKFEKDIDPNLAEIAINRACSLVEQLGAGEVMQGTIDIYPERIEMKTLEVSASWMNKFLGTDIRVEKMKEYLDRLELSATINGDTLVVKVPTFRSDINIKEDVAEEVARIYGYNNIPTTVMNGVSLNGGKTKKQKLEDKIIEVLIGSGLNQSISYSFVSPKVFDKILVPQDSELRKTVTIKNPLGEDFSIMRTTSIPSMMESLSRNYSRSNEEARLFEIGKVYIPNEDPNKLPKETNIITLGMYGKVDYYELKGIVENIIGILGISNISFQRESNNATFHPGKTAAIYSKKEYIGILGEIHPDVNDNYGIEERCYVAVLDLDLLVKLTSMDKRYKALPKYPAVTRDLAVLVDESILVQQIEDIIRKQGSNMLESIKLFDVYKGSQIPEDKKSIAYSLTYRLENKTLTDVEVNKVHDKILRSLEHQLGAQLR